MKTEQEQQVIEFEELENEATHVDHSYTADDIQVNNCTILSMEYDKIILKFYIVIS